MVTVWWSAASMIYYSFLNPGKTITSKKYDQQINEMHQKLRHLQLALVNRKDHNNAWLNIAQPTLRKLSELGYKVLLHPPYSFDLLPTTYHFFSISITFCRENTSTTSKRQKMLSKSLSNPEAQIFHATGINKFISHWQKCVDSNGSYFDW